MIWNVRFCQLNNLLFTYYHEKLKGTEWTDYKKLFDIEIDKKINKSLIYRYQIDINEIEIYVIELHVFWGPLGKALKPIDVLTKGVTTEVHWSTTFKANNYVIRDVKLHACRQDNNTSKGQ